MIILAMMALTGLPMAATNIFVCRLSLVHVGRVSFSVMVSLFLNRYYVSERWRLVVLLRSSIWFTSQNIASVEGDYSQKSAGKSSDLNQLWSSRNPMMWKLNKVSLFLDLSNMMFISQIQEYNLTNEAIPCPYHFIKHRIRIAKAFPSLASMKWKFFIKEKRLNN